MPGRHRRPGMKLGPLDITFYAAMIALALFFLYVLIGPFFI
jgi:hypothetical protein